MDITEEEMKRFSSIAVCWLILSLFPLAAAGTEIYKINLKKEIGSTTWRYVRQGMAEAQARGAGCVVLHMNTYGGTVVHADSIRTLLLNAPLPVYAFIDNNAASAGALIAIACDSIYMRPGASIGAATVVNQTGDAAPDKYQSYMRAIIRSTAETHGQDTTVTPAGDTLLSWRRDPLIAEAMVDEQIEIPHLSEAGKVLTLTAREAVQNGYCEAIVHHVGEIADRLGYTDYVIEEYRPRLFDEVAGFLTNPALQALLVMIIIGGIWFELQTPGVGFPLAAALIAALIYFTPLYIEGFAAGWEILLFILGVILLVLEFLVIPGFGVAGISGALLLLAALILALIGNIDFDFTPVAPLDASRSILTVLTGAILGFAALLLLARKIGTKGPFYQLALHQTQEPDEGFVGVPGELHSQVGREGITVTVLHPSGKVHIDGQDYDAIALYSTFIEKGTPVRVVRTENAQLYVTPIQPQP